MEQYIDKNRVEEILRNLWKKDDGYNAEHRICYNKALQEVQCELDTLEVKEVEGTESLKVRGYLVRDKDDYTAIYAEKPHRGKTEWVDGNDSCLMAINDARLVPDIEFEDEPVEIEVTLKRLSTGG